MGNRRSSRSSNVVESSERKRAAASSSASGIEERLEVVEEQERTRVAELLQLSHARRARNSRAHELRPGQRCKRYEEDAAGKEVEQLGSHLQPEPRLTASSWARKRDEAHRVGEHRRQLRELRLTADEWIRGDRKVRRIETPERREVAVSELEDPLRRCEVFEAMQPQV